MLSVQAPQRMDAEGKVWNPLGCTKLNMFSRLIGVISCIGLFELKTAMCSTHEIGLSLPGTLIFLSACVVCGKIMFSVVSAHLFTWIWSHYILELTPLLPPCQDLRTLQQNPSLCQDPNPNF